MQPLLTAESCLHAVASPCPDIAAFMGARCCQAAHLNFFRAGRCRSKPPSAHEQGGLQRYRVAIDSAHMLEIDNKLGRHAP